MRALRDMAERWQGLWTYQLPLPPPKKIIPLQKNVFTSAAAIHDVVPRPRKFYTKWSAHDGQRESDYQTKTKGRLEHPAGIFKKNVSVWGNISPLFFEHFKEDTA